MHILCLGSRLICLAAKGAKTKHRRTERRAKWKPLQQRTFSHACSFAQRLGTVWEVFGTALMEFVLKNPCQQLCSFSLAHCQRSYACPMAHGFGNFGKNWAHSSSEQSYWWKLSWKTSSDSCAFWCRSLPKQLSPSYFHVLELEFFRAIALMEIVPKTRATSFAFLHRPLTAELPPSYSHASQSMHARLAFPPRSLQRSSPPKLSPSFTVHHVVRRFHLAPFSGGPPKLFPRFTVHPRSSGASVSLPPAEIPPSYFRAISSYFHAFHSVRARAFLPSLLVQLFCLAPLAAK